MRADPRPPDAPGILIHALLPVPTHGLHGGDALLAGRAPVLAVALGAQGHLGQGLGGGLVRGFVHVGPDRRPEGPDDVDEEEDEEDVQQQLCVEGEDVGEVRVRFDEGEEAEEGAGPVGVGGGLAGGRCFAGGW